MLTTDAGFGNEALEELHEALANAILAFAGLHVAAALFESWKHGENLVRSMITGRKRA
jgi:cytochrome b